MKFYNLGDKTFETDFRCLLLKYRLIFLRVLKVFNRLLGTNWRAGGEGGWRNFRPMEWLQAALIIVFLVFLGLGVKIDQVGTNKGDNV